MLVWESWQVHGVVVKSGRHRPHNRPRPPPPALLQPSPPSSPDETTRRSPFAVRRLPVLSWLGSDPRPRRALGQRVAEYEAVLREDQGGVRAQMDAEKVYKMTRATQRADKLHAVACRE
jgi:hypothetical protein